MNAALRLSAYTAVLALVFAAAWGVGAAVGAPATAPAQAAPVASAAPHAVGAGTADDGHAHPHGADDVDSAGLVATAAGYTFVPKLTTYRPGVPAELAFTITGSDRRPVTGFDVE